MAISTLTAKRCIHQGLLQKRCRLSWRPRHVEVISDPTDMAGHIYSFQLLIYDPRKRMLKDQIRMESIVTIRASRDCHFQIFLSNGKIVQFKTETIASQAHWIAMLKMGLGRGSIFHVFLNSVSEIEHALLFSVGVNLPPHRIGQLDRVLVLASPINDINLHAWDLNRVTRFVELDIGIRMELCPSCVRGQTTTLTFVIEKQFVKDCMRFLRKEGHISTPPADDHGLLIHTVPHRCFYNTPPSEDAPPPPYSEAPPLPSKQRVNKTDSAPNGTVHIRQMTSQNGTGVMEIRTHSRSKPCSLPVSNTLPLSSMWDDSHSSRSGSLTSESPFQQHHVEATDTVNYISDLPPRTIPRPNYESALPAEAHPYLQYQPHFYSSSGNRHFEPPYQVSSRIIITDSGEVQFERNVMGSLPRSGNSKFHFNREMPVPPRGLGVDSSTDILHTKVTLEAKCGHQGDLRGSINVDNAENVSDITKTHRRSSYMGPFETREYVNFPISITPPPTAKHAGRYTHGLNRTSSDSQLNYSTRSTARMTVGAPRVKRASQVSVTSDIYIIPRSPLPGHLPFTSSTVEEDGPLPPLTTHGLCLDDSVAEINPSLIIFKLEHDEPEYVNVNGSDDMLGHHTLCKLTETGSTTTCPPALNQPSNQGSAPSEIEKPQSPVPLPRRKPTVTPRNNALQRSIILSSEPQNKSKDDSYLHKQKSTVTPRNNTLQRSISSEPQNKSKDDSYLHKQKPPVPRPRTKTSVQVSLNVSLRLSDENLDSSRTVKENDNPVKLHSKSFSGFYEDENGVGVSDV